MWARSLLLCGDLNRRGAETPRGRVAMKPSGVETVCRQLHVCLLTVIRRTQRNPLIISGPSLQKGMYTGSPGQPLLNIPRPVAR